jgi:hypothetical protein
VNVPTEVLATPRADQQIDGLRRKQAKALESFLDDLAARGCQALAYRLTGGSPIDHICVKHLRNSLRVIVAFETPQKAWILLVGTHDNRNTGLDVYTELYRLAGVEPEPASGRNKPPCCGQADGEPPTIGDELVEILTRAAKQRKAR